MRPWRVLTAVSREVYLGGTGAACPPAGGLRPTAHLPENEADMEQADLLLRGGRVVTPAGVIEGDVAVAGGRNPVGGRGGRAGPRGNRRGRQMGDAGGGGRLDTPAFPLVDPHAHIEQMSVMGLMCADTFETATRSAANGRDDERDLICRASEGRAGLPPGSPITPPVLRGAVDDRHAFHLIVADTSVEAFEADLAELIAAGHRSIKVFTNLRDQARRRRHP